MSVKMGVAFIHDVLDYEHDDIPNDRFQFAWLFCRIYLRVAQCCALFFWFIVKLW